MAVIRAVWIPLMLRKVAFLISFRIRYTGSSFTKGKRIRPSHNCMRQEHLKWLTIHPFTKTNVQHDQQLFSYNPSVRFVTINIGGQVWTQGGVFRDYTSVTSQQPPPPLSVYSDISIERGLWTPTVNPCFKPCGIVLEQICLGLIVPY
jgi:hypothetical protein